MPAETQMAVDWALQQTYVDGDGNTREVTAEDASMMVDMVRKYFNTHKIQYNSFSYDDLTPYL